MLLKTSKCTFLCVDSITLSFKVSGCNVDESDEFAECKLQCLLAFRRSVLYKTKLSMQ